MSKGQFSNLCDVLSACQRGFEGIMILMREEARLLCKPHIVHWKTCCTKRRNSALMECLIILNQTLF